MARDRLLARLALIGDRLGGHPAPEFRSRLRDDLLNAQRPEPADDTGRSTEKGIAKPAPRHVPRHAVRRLSPRPVRIPLSVRLCGLVVAMALVMSGASWGAYRSMPGDVLYPIKRASESALLKLSLNDVTRARRELVTARTRASEAAALADTPGPERDKLLRETIDDMDSTTRSAIRTLSRVKRPDKPPAKALKRFAKQQRDMVEPLLPNLSNDSRQKADAYLHLIEGFESSGR